MKNVNKILIALGAGVVVGGVLGMLFAPKKGSELRKDISDKGKKFSDEVKTKYREGKEKLNGMRKNAEEMADEFA
jgi:gas vesicle protein